MNGTAVYSAGLMSQSFWFLEFKKAVKLRQDGLGYDEIKKKCIEENLFGAATENRVKRMAGCVKSPLAMRLINTSVWAAT